MPDDKIRVSARISRELYDVCLQRYDNIKNAINAGLELLRNKDEDKSEDIHQQSEDGNEQSDIPELEAWVDKKAARIRELQEYQQNRIEDLKDHIYLLDNQLRTKDDQIEKLNENMNKQAFHIQSLIEENSRLNVKLLPENTEKKNPFW